MRAILVIMAIVISISAYHLFVIEKYYIKASSVSILDINSLLDKLENDLYSSKISPSEYKAKADAIREQLNKESGIVLNSSSVIYGVSIDITPKYMSLVE